MAITDNLVSWYDLSESSGNDAVDAHGSNDLTDTNTVASSSSDGPGGTWTVRDYEIDNSEMHVITGAYADPFKPGSYDIAFCTWLKAEQDANKVLASKGSAEWDLQYRSSQGARFSYNGSTVDTWAANSAGVWYFYMGWYDYDAATIYSESDDAGEASTGSVSSTSGATSAFALAGFNGAANYDGMLASAAFWSGGFPTDGERTSLYNSGSGGHYADFSGGGASVYPCWYYTMITRGCKPEEAEYEARRIVAKLVERRLAARRDRISFKARDRWQLDPVTKMYLPPAMGIITPRYFIGRAA